MGYGDRRCLMQSLITGGAGFIGSHVADALSQRGDRVAVLDDLSTGSEANLAAALGAGAELIVGDVSDRATVEDAVARLAPDRIFHLAAQADVRRAVAEPLFDARVNVLGTVNVLEAAQRNGLPPVVFAATGGAAYGEGEGKRLPFAETAPALPETAYGASKLAGEIYVGLYRRLYGLPAVALRLGNVYGPRQDPHGEAGVVAIFCGKALEGAPPTVYGDGRQTRDYVYVADVVAAMLAAEEALLARGSRLEGPLNVGTGSEVSVLELIEVVAAVSGRRLEPEHAPRRDGEVQRVAIDPSAADSALGWRADVGLEEGLRCTYEALADQRAAASAEGVR